MGDGSLKLSLILLIVAIILAVKAESDAFLFPEFVEGEVINIIYDSGPWEHTVVYFRTYSETSIIKQFTGKVELNHGDICRVHYHRAMFRFYNTILDIEMLEG